MAAVLTNHIIVDGNDVAWIDDTNTKVVEVALDHIAHGWSADQIHEQHPHLSLAQIHAALGYYFDHQAAFDQRIAEQTAQVAALKAASPGLPPAFRAKLEARRQRQ